MADDVQAREAALLQGCLALELGVQLGLDVLRVDGPARRLGSGQRQALAALGLEALVGALAPTAFFLLQPSAFLFTLRLRLAGGLRWWLGLGLLAEAAAGREAVAALAHRRSPLEITYAATRTVVRIQNSRTSTASETSAVTVSDRKLSLRSFVQRRATPSSISSSSFAIGPIFTENRWARSRMKRCAVRQDGPLVTES